MADKKQVTLYFTEKEKVALDVLVSKYGERTGKKASYTSYVKHLMEQDGGKPKAKTKRDKLVEQLNWLDDKAIDVICSMADELIGRGVR